jgi:hypothetical protein
MARRAAQPVCCIDVLVLGMTTWQAGSTEYHIATSARNDSISRLAGRLLAEAGHGQGPAVPMLLRRGAAGASKVGCL